jgi:predicted GH43/DUF377 family glycosyl hydrolase
LLLRQKEKRKRYMIKLERLTDQPILRPRQEYEWERSAVFNAAAIYHEGLFHLLYRTTDNPPHAKYGTYISRIGHAVSSDGINFYRWERPIFEGEHAQEQRGVEDPRVVKIDDMFYMTYTGFGGRFDGDYRIMMAYSQDLVHWERMGVVMDEPNKDAALFPERIGGRYVMFHRMYPNIWIAFSDDLIHWTDHHEVIKIRPGTWESARVGIAGPPIKTDKGWLVIYHAADDNNVYRLGIALLDLNDPTKVLYRQPEPILEPELSWEVEGYIPNVVFSCGQAEVGDDIWLYYGGADTVIGVAKTSKQKLKFA